MSPKPLVPSFSSSIIEDNRSDGYWVETFHFSKEDRVPGVITSGLVSGVIEFLDNPIASAEFQKSHNPKSTQTNESLLSSFAAWNKYEIGKFHSPVAVVAVDITKSGLTDIVICHDYGPFMLECDMKGGHITWLENPGREGLDKGHWKERYIGRWPAMHRIKAGFFTQKSFLEIIAASVVYGEHDKTTPIPIIRFQAPEKVLEATEWPHDIIDDRSFTVIHEITVKKLSGPNGLDSMIISSREGATWLYYEDNEWKRDLITIGEPRAPGQSKISESPGSGDHWGTGCADVGRIGDDPVAYIATLDPFHGTTACVYTKADRGLKEKKWKRHILDVYGTPNQQMKTGDGPGHYIVCADFDGDGDDEFLLSLFGSLDRDEKGESIPPNTGPNPNKGIMYYKAIDLKNGVFAKWKIAEESSARIAIGGFSGTGRIDLVSMAYNVARYYEEPHPVVTIHTNEFAPKVPQQTAAPITSTVWDGEGMVYFVDPVTIQSSHSLPLIEVANYAISVEIHPKKGKVPVLNGEGVKVLYGSISDGSGARNPLGTAPFPAASTTLTKDSSMEADPEKGAILLRLRPIHQKTFWHGAGEVHVKNIFDVGQIGLQLKPLHFIKVENLWWGGKFKGVDFYNMSGFYFRFLEDKTPIAHIQFWTAGPGVNCGVHNHSGDIFQEIHICLSPGTETGGMSRLKDAYVDTPPDQLNGLPQKAFDHLPLQLLYEHGGLWYRDSYGNAVRGRDNVVSYPWHKWQAGNGSNIDIWMALEFNPALKL
ncbi:hypothetical protein K432DRAFT_295373 [Lepidopterella palustris CBS 459.81]|uniref:Aldos-2-ulose dehydratase/isomerase (AUDH) Cupin domain-containing protein n=1 Tax=Lepidopterella palustris CBS 459.81 TaxID=1314670 RepID=A0A8E2ECX6_9PEZI|nr:hypothetical protein K432DRAFT_295373 [Lepidopterella palustris CBS 459.81]